MRYAVSKKTDVSTWGWNEEWQVEDRLRLMLRQKENVQWTVAVSHAYMLWLLFRVDGSVDDKINI